MELNERNQRRDAPIGRTNPKWRPSGGRGGGGRRWGCVGRRGVWGLICLTISIAPSAVTIATTTFKMAAVARQIGRFLLNLGQFFFVLFSYFLKADPNEKKLWWIDDKLTISTKPNNKKRKKEERKRNKKESKNRRGSLSLSSGLVFLPFFSLCSSVARRHAAFLNVFLYFFVTSCAEQERRFRLICRHLFSPRQKLTNDADIHWLWFILLSILIFLEHFSFSLSLSLSLSLSSGFLWLLCSSILSSFSALFFIIISSFPSFSYPRFYYVILCIIFFCEISRRSLIQWPKQDIRPTIANIQRIPNSRKNFVSPEHPRASQNIPAHSRTSWSISEHPIASHSNPESCLEHPSAFQHLLKHPRASQSISEHLRASQSLLTWWKETAQLLACFPHHRLTFSGPFFPYFWSILIISFHCSILPSPSSSAASSVIHHSSEELFKEVNKKNTFIHL